MLACALLFLLGLNPLLVSPAAARGDSLGVAFHQPPTLHAFPDKTAFELDAGWFQTRGAGLALSGVGGGWEVSRACDEGLGWAVHSRAYLLRGAVEPRDSGRLKTAGFTGSLEGDVLWTAKPWRVYGGGLVSLSGLDLFDTRSVAGFVEPSGAYSLIAGLPLGVEAFGDLGGDWAAQAGVSVVPYLGGSTVFTYLLPGRRLYGTSRHIDAHAAVGARVRLEQKEWRLALEAGGSMASRSGNSRGLSSFWFFGAWRVL